MSTAENLQAAFAGESQANRKYLAFAEKADKDGFAQVAKLFRAAAHAETVHAHNHLRAMAGIKDTVANVKAAIEGEGHEFKEMYPEFLQTAQAENEGKAARSFEWALAVEEEHYGYYTDALNAVEGGKDLPGNAIFVCEGCGHTVYGAAPEKCPVCGALKQRFTEIA